MLQVPVEKAGFSSSLGEINTYQYLLFESNVGHLHSADGLYFYRIKLLLAVQKAVVLGVVVWAWHHSILCWPKYIRPITFPFTNVSVSFFIIQITLISFSSGSCFHVFLKELMSSVMGRRVYCEGTLSSFLAIFTMYLSIPITWPFLNVIML